MSLLPGPLARRYSAKFALGILLTVVVIAAVGAVGYLDTQRQVQADTEEQLESTATVQANALGEWVSNRQQTARIVSSAEQLQPREAGEPAQNTQDYIFGLRQQNQPTTVLHVHYVDISEGRVVNSTQDEFVGRPLSAIDQPWATEQVRQELVRETSTNVWTSERPFGAGAINQTAMAFASPVRDQSSQYAVVLVSALGLRADQLYQPGTGQETGVVDANGTLVLSGENPERFDGRVIDAGRIDAARAGNATFRRTGDYAVAYAAVPNTDWVAVSTVPSEQAFALQRSVGFNTALMVAGSLLALVVTGAVLGVTTTRPLSDLQAKARSMEDGDLDVDLSTSREDEIGELYAAFDSMRTSLRRRIEEAERAREEVQQLNRDLQRTADRHSEVMRTCAEGDLTVRMDEDVDSEAMRSIAAEFNEMVADLERTVDAVRRFADEVAVSSEEVTASAEEVRSASERVSESIQEISEGASRQDEQFQEIDGEMSDLSTTTEEIAAAANEVASLSERTASAGQEGRALAGDAESGMSEIRERSSEAVAAIDELRGETEEIDRLADTIEELADETNMLALNANIEASRGGDGDGGFEVVAEQITELSKETREATDDIERRLGRIREGIDRTARTVQATDEQVAESTEDIRAAVERLEAIAGYAEETNEGVQEISAATEQQSAAAQQVAAMVDEVAQISRDTAQEARQVASAAEEQTAAVNEVSESVGGLAGQADDLADAMDAFDTAADGDGDDTGGSIDVETTEQTDGDATDPADAEPDAGDDD